MKLPEIRRSRPLLGTFVEIVACGLDEAVLHRAASRAFHVIEQLQSRLSRYDDASEVSGLNRHATERPIRVGIDTWSVLRTAVRVSRQSSGAFDVTTFPGRGFSGHSDDRGDFRDIEFLPGRHIRFVRPLCIDLGGIAKGYCVDRAVAALRRCGVAAGLVNAGGDLRAFGERTFMLHLRHPIDHGQLLPWSTLRNAAVATSANYAAGNDRRAGVVLDGRNGTRIRSRVSVTVRASRAAIADALTKVVAAIDTRAAPLLAHYRARAWVVKATGDNSLRAGKDMETTCATHA